MPQLPISDEYFNRSAAVVADTPRYAQRVRYRVFARRPGVLCGMNRSVAFIDQQCVGPLRIHARRDGDVFAANEVVLIIEGMFGELVNLETTYLGMLAFTGAATNMREIVEAARGVPVTDMAARHYPFEIIEQTAYAAAVGGAVGTSTRAGYHYVHKWLGIGHGDMIRVGGEAPRSYKLYGSIPHALNAVYNASSVEAAAAYHDRLPDVPLTVLIDFEGRELDVCREAFDRFGPDLYAVRLDTSGSRLHQGGHEEPVKDLVDRILATCGTGIPPACTPPIDAARGTGILPVVPPSGMGILPVSLPAGGMGVPPMVPPGNAPPVPPPSRLHPDRNLSTQHSALSTQHSALSTEHVPQASSLHPDQRIAPPSSPGGAEVCSPGREPGVTGVPAPEAPEGRQNTGAASGPPSESSRAAIEAALARYGFGKGVTIEEAYNVRRVLDEVGAKHTQIVVSSGFDAAKVAAFRLCDAPMDAIGTGSWVGFTVFTSDISHVCENGQWLPRSKAGRSEELTDPADLPVRIDRR